jgi:ribosomal protein L24E
MKEKSNLLNSRKKCSFCGYKFKKKDGKINTHNDFGVVILCKQCYNKIKK